MHKVCRRILHFVTRPIVACDCLLGGAVGKRAYAESADGRLRCRMVPLTRIMAAAKGGRNGT